jgi:CO/xanthine dehydrogenase Mo-binding subunit
VADKSEDNKLIGRDYTPPDIVAKVTGRAKYAEDFRVLAKRFHSNKPPTILDAPHLYAFAALDIPDPETPVGARGIGEPPVGAGCGAVLNALAAAVGDEVFRRMPVTADMMVMALENGGKFAHEPLTANI